MLIKCFASFERFDGDDDDDDGQLYGPLIVYLVLVLHDKIKISIGVLQ